MADFTLTSFSPSASSSFALLEEEVVTVISEPVAFVENEAWNEPDVTIWVDGTAADFVEDESVAATAASGGPTVVTSEPVAFVEDESASFAQTVRAFSAAAFEEDEGLAVSGYAVPPVGQVNGELHAVEDESLSVTATVRVYSEAVAFIEGEGLAATAQVTVYSSAAFVEDEALDASVRPVFSVHPSNILSIQRASPRILTR